MPSCHSLCRLDPSLVRLNIPDRAIDHVRYQTSTSCQLEPTFLHDGGRSSPSRGSRSPFQRPMPSLQPTRVSSIPFLLCLPFSISRKHYHGLGILEMTTTTYRRHHQILNPIFDILPNEIIHITPFFQSMSEPDQRVEELHEVTIWRLGVFGRTRLGE